MTADYQTQMQQAALAYLRRHQDQYLPGDDLLFEACVGFLVRGLEVPVFMAERLAGLAWSDFETRPVWVGVDLAGPAQGPDTYHPPG